MYKRIIILMVFAFLSSCFIYIDSDYPSEDVIDAGVDASRETDASICDN